MTIEQVKEKHSRTIERGKLPMFSPVCTFCSHYNASQTCQAFPDGIPQEIWIGKNKHLSPYPGDSGIQFQSVKDSTLKVAS